MRKWLAVLGVCLLAAAGIPIGYATWYVESYARHSCQALEILTATPVPRPADPAADPSREQTWRFYQGLVYWEHADGC